MIGRVKSGRGHFFIALPLAQITEHSDEDADDGENDAVVDVPLDGAQVREYETNERGDGERPHPFHTPMISLGARARAVHDHRRDDGADDGAGGDVGEPMKTDGRARTHDGGPYERDRARQEPAVYKKNDDRKRERDARMRRRPSPEDTVAQNSEIKIAADVDRSDMREEFRLDAAGKGLVKRGDGPRYGDRVRPGDTREPLACAAPRATVEDESCRYEYGDQKAAEARDEDENSERFAARREIVLPVDSENDEDVGERYGEDVPIRISSAEDIDEFSPQLTGNIF